ncbi:MAG: type II toxin-antitoxin system VapC family toxin [Desulfurococcales archaeon]|nr:type II toxin-antitoxin system VapC family toxin [Desulfurococcales archaeon]
MEKPGGDSKASGWSVVAVATRPCAYVNTSIVVRALNPREPGSLEARRFLEECCKRCQCVYSSVHELERMTPFQRLQFEGYLEGLGAQKAGVDVRMLLLEAEEYRRRHRLSQSRLNDIMHLLAARELGCRCLLAVDRFLRARSRDFNLAYANHYTGCQSCCPQRSGVGTGTGPGYSSASSSKQATQTRPGRSTGSGLKPRSHSRKQGRGLRRSQGRSKPRKKHRGKHGRKGKGG